MKNMIKKIIAIATVLTVSVWLVGPGVAQAVTAEELQDQIDALLATLTDLQAQLADLTGEATTVAGCTITSFDRNLSVGSTGDDVNCLQIVLNSASDTQLASSGVGSPGNETSYFGPLTKGGVIKFQEKYADEVLASWGLTSGTGFVGTTTRVKLDTLLAAGEQEEEEEEEEEEVAAGLTVALASDTPDSVTIADNANANITKFTLTAGSEGNVSITKIYVLRSGLTANSDIENIKIVEADTGVHRGSIGSLNVNNKAMVTFTPALVIEAGTTESFFIRAGIVDDTTAGKTVILGIASADDIVSNASEVNGLPVSGNAMNVVQIAIGSANVNEDGTTINTTPDVGDSDVVVNQFRVVAGSVEAVTIEQITVVKSGTSDASDTNNIELYDVTNSVSLGTVDSWDAEGKSSWSGLDIEIAKGKTQRFKVKVDIVDGPTLTVNADFIDGSDVLMTVKGNTYGYYITPGILSSWDGLGSNSQVINTGALNISKSTSTPATGNVSSGDDIELAVFDFDAKGEEVRITAITITITQTDYDVGGEFTYVDITNVAIYDEDDNIAAGPINLTVTVPTEDANFTDTFIVPVGAHEYSVRATISTDAETLDTVIADVKTPGTTSVLTARGMTSNNSITATPSSGDVAGNTLTIAAGALSLTTLTQPEARDVAVGSSDFVWMTVSLDAGTSGEDVQVSTLSALDTTGTEGDADDVDNMEVWADLTSESSARGDIYETRVSDAENPSGNALAADVTTSFNLTQVITVPKGTFKKVALVADLNADAGTSGTPTHTFSASAITATGAVTGNDISEGASGSGQAMTAAASGDLTVTLDSSTPSADIVLGEQTAVLGVFRLASTNIEDLDLDSIYIAITNGTYIDTLYFYHGDTVIQSAPGATAVYVAIADGSVTIPANGHEEITVKGTLNRVGAGLTLDDGNDITVGFDGSTTIIGATGLGSGQTANSDDAVQANAMTAYESRPYFAVNSLSPSGDLLPSSQALLAVFDVTAHANEDITFESTSDQIVVQIGASVTDSDGTQGTWYLKDAAGTTYSSINVLDSALNGSGTVTFTFTTATFTVPAGQTKKMYIYGDTQDFETDGDVIQLWLDDAADVNCTFGIDLDQNHQEGVIIFRGDIYAGSFVNPS